MLFLSGGGQTIHTYIMSDKLKINPPSQIQGNNEEKKGEVPYTHLT